MRPDWMNYDTLGRRIAETSRLARRYNTAIGQVSMALGCVKCIYHLPGLSAISKMELDAIVRRLTELRMSLKTDYEIEKFKLIQAQIRRKENESAKTQ